MTLSDLIALITLLFGVGGTAVGVYNYIRTHDPAPKQIWISAGVAFVAICLVLAVVLAFLSATRNSIAGTAPIVDVFANKTPTSLATHTPDPTATLVPTATAAPTATPTGSILYQADWSKGFDGWGASADWKFYNGMLINDGTNSFCNPGLSPTLVPPFQPTTPDYSIEIQVQIVRSTGSCYSGFGILVRGNSDGSTGYTASYLNGNVSIAGGNINQATASFGPGGGWHTYRFEVHGTSLKFFIDGGLAVATTDAVYLTTPGQIGIWDTGLYLNLRSCVVRQL
jgi:hypothetical protein